ncbi:prostaglandin D2 receptor-like [Carcharodon carcharias]|uniref:prostaglandin D2 receptor-like n=1 Tax=Carcharodon carcharias TaxID=13397 RepID=UPI001B7E44EF|nr:prostaglandin D2 receptor-like [Carcharodon carcharias]
MTSCENLTYVSQDGKVLSSILLFTTGLIGNIIALAILGKHKRDSKHQVSVFYILVTGLVLTDLFGKCVISPVVFASYASNLSLTALAKNNTLCDYFSFSMSFFGLASMFILFAMALECWLSISHPFLYQEQFTKRRVVLIFPVVYICCLLFCSMPLMGFGRNKQYCPGTWCFLNMAKEESTLSFSVLYATLMAILVFAVMLCNASVAVNLTKMYRRQRRMSNANLNSLVRTRKRFIHTAEVEHLILLILMSILFLICSLPLTIRAYIGAFAPDNKDIEDLNALRLASVNSIVDPWVFIIFRTSVFRNLTSMCCNGSTPTLDLECWPAEK